MKVIRGLYFLILGVLFCLIFPSCESRLENQSFINLQDQYELIITQELSTNGGLAAMTIKTVNELECSNYFIPSIIDLESVDIKVELYNVTLEDKCVSTPSYISQTVNFGLATGETNLTILLQDVISNSGKISVTDDEIAINLDSHDGIKISKHKINRVKKNMMWGSVKAGAPSSKESIKEFFLSIDSGTSVNTGDYGLFQVPINADLEDYGSSLFPDEQFVLISESSREDIESKIQEIKESDPSLVFELTLFDGQTINVE
jgi:hypothetical protein